MDSRAVERFHGAAARARRPEFDKRRRDDVDVVASAREAADERTENLNWPAERSTWPIRRSRDQDSEGLLAVGHGRTLAR